MKKSVDKQVTTTTTHRHEITAEDIIRQFELPAHAKVVFYVPSGGDWSNCDFDIDVDNPIVVEWREVSYE